MNRLFDVKIERDNKVLAELYQEFDKLTTYHFSEYDYSSVFGFDLITLDRILKRNSLYDDSKSMRDNLIIIHNTCATDLVQSIMELEKLRV